MSDIKDKMIEQIPERDFLLTECLLKITTLENLLISKGIISSEDLVSEMKNIATKVMSVLKDKGIVPVTEKPNTN